MAKRNTFILYKSWLGPVKELTDADAGILFTAIFNYVNDRKVIIPENIRPLFVEIREQINIEWGKVNPKTNKYHWNWKGGITSENHTIRNSYKYKEWRASVFERDDYTCQECFDVGGTLHAHHIKHFAEHPKLRFVIDNGVTLCKECHKLEHEK